VLALGLQATKTQIPIVGHGWAQLDPQIWPVEMLDALNHPAERWNMNRRRMKIFNEYSYGGFLIYYAPEYKVFIDGRTELYGEEFLKEFVNPSGVPPAELIARWEAKYGEFDFALVGNHESPCFADHFRQSLDWIEVKKTETAVLFRRNSARD
jgi:hypothetical protein